jgi:hypothetical protein
VVVGAARAMQFGAATTTGRRGRGGRGRRGGSAFAQKLTAHAQCITQLITAQHSTAQHSTARCK